MSEEEKKVPKTLSRREFLRDVGVAVSGTAVGSAFFLTASGKEVGAANAVTAVAPASAASSIALLGKPQPPPAPSAGVVSLTVNGKTYECAVENNTVLRDVLRDQIGLTSIKDMCTGYGACGSCAVIMNGRPILSCLALANECGGTVIETAEGMAKNNHPLIEAYIQNHCMQCGYCTPGLIVTAKALLDHIPHPTEAQIKEAISGNICRCGTYPAHVSAVLQVSTI